MSGRRTSRARTAIVAASAAAVCLFVVVYLLAAQSIGMWPAGHLDKPALPLSASPEEVARRYFEAQSAGDADAISAVIWHQPGGSQQRGLLGYLRDGTVVGVTSGRPIRNSFSSAFSEAQELVVTYDRVHTDEVGTPPGEDMAFVILGRVRETGQWVFISAGTGP